MEKMYVILADHQTPDMTFVEVEDKEGKSVHIDMEPYENHPGLYRLGPFAHIVAFNAIVEERDEARHYANQVDNEQQFPIMKDTIVELQAKERELYDLLRRLHKASKPIPGKCDHPGCIHDKVDEYMSKDRRGT